jgi:hypothetical protein
MTYGLVAVFTLLTPFLFALGAYEHYAGRKGGLYTATAVLCLVFAVALAWAAGKGWAL